MGTEPVTPRPLSDIVDYPIPTLDIVDIGAMLEDGRDRYDALVAQNLARGDGFRAESDRVRQPCPAARALSLSARVTR
jgi:hypothetical protein